MKSSQFPPSKYVASLCETTNHSSLETLEVVLKKLFKGQKLSLRTHTCRFKRHASRASLFFSFCESSGGFGVDGTDTTHFSGSWKTNHNM